MQMRKYKQLKAIYVFALLYLAIGVINIFILGKFELCFFRMIFGIPCPGCGLTHSVIALLTGHPKASFFYHPLTIPIVINIGIGMASCIGVEFRNLKFAKISRFLVYNHKWHLSLLIAMVLLYLLRMICLFPSDDYPMVYDKNNYVENIVVFICDAYPRMGRP